MAAAYWIYDQFPAKKTILIGDQRYSRNALWKYVLVAQHQIRGSGFERSWLAAIPFKYEWTTQFPPASTPSSTPGQSLLMYHISPTFVYIYWSYRMTGNQQINSLNSDPICWCAALCWSGNGLFIIRSNVGSLKLCSKKNPRIRGWSRMDADCWQDDSDWRPAELILFLWI